MKKRTIGAIIIVFIFISCFVLSEHSEMRVVKFRNQKIAISQENANIENKSVEIKHKESKIANQDIETSNTQTRINNTNITSSNEHNFSYQNTTYQNSSEYSYNKSRYKETNITFNPNDKSFESSNYKMSEPSRYRYEGIDWGTWKSNFINQFLDDSLLISSLDNYSVGNWFYYSFVVTNEGAIKDVKVFSFTLKERDKAQIESLIRSYAYKDITIFPKNSQRKTARVKAIVLLSNTESKANPHSFYDTERIRVEY